MSDEIKVTAQQTIYNALVENKRAGDDKAQDTEKLSSVFAQLTTDSNRQDGISVDEFVDNIYSQYNSKGKPTDTEKETLIKIVSEIAAMDGKNDTISIFDVGLDNFKNETVNAAYGSYKVSDETSQKLDEILSDLIDKNNSNGISAKDFYLAICDTLGIEAKDFDKDSDALLTLIKELATEDANSATINSLDFENYAVNSIANLTLETTGAVNEDVALDTDSSSLKEPKEIFKGNLAETKVEVKDGKYFLQTQDWTEKNQNDMNILNTMGKITQGIYGVDFYSQEGQKIYEAIKKLNPGFVDETWNKNHPDKDGWMINCGTNINLPNPEDLDGSKKLTIPESFKGEYTNKIYKNNDNQYVIKTESYSTGKNGELSTTSSIIKSIYGYDLDSEEGQKIFESLKINNPGFFKNGEGTDIEADKELLLVNAEKVLAKDGAISGTFEGKNAGKLIYVDKDGNKVINADKNSSTTDSLEDIVKSVYGLDVNDRISRKANQAKEYLNALKESNKDNIDKDGNIIDFSKPVIIPDPDKISDYDGSKNKHTGQYASYYENLSYLSYYEKFEGTPFFDKIIEVNDPNKKPLAKVMRDDHGNAVSCYVVGGEYFIKSTGQTFEQ